MSQCKKKEFDRAIADNILSQQDDYWLLEVKGRLELANDFRAEDVIYQGDCNSRFRSGKKKTGVDIATSSRKRGRPTIKGEKGRFEEIVEYLCKREYEQITISKLNDMIKEEVSGKPYFCICHLL